MLKLLAILFILIEILMQALLLEPLLQPATFKSSCSQMFFKIGVLKIFTNFTGKRLCWSLCFHAKIAKFLKRPFLTDHLRRPFLNFIKKFLLRCFSMSFTKFFKSSFLSNICNRHRESFENLLKLGLTI